MGQSLARPPPSSTQNGVRYRHSSRHGSRLARGRVDELYYQLDSDSENQEHHRSRNKMAKHSSRVLSNINGSPQLDIAVAAAATAATRAKELKKKTQPFPPRSIQTAKKTSKNQTRQIRGKDESRRTRSHTSHRPQSLSPSPSPSRSPSPTRSRAQSYTQRAGHKSHRHRSDRYNDYAPRPNPKSKSKSERKSKGSTTSKPSKPSKRSSSPGPLKDCPICISSLSSSHFPVRPPTSTCLHTPNTCTHCLRHWIRTQFRTKLWTQIQCPECPSLLSHGDMSLFAPRSVFTQYDRLSTRAALEEIPGFTWCLARGCGSGQVQPQTLSQTQSYDENGNGDNMPSLVPDPKFKCVSCKAVFCLRHARKWHRGETCAEFEYRTDGRVKRGEEEASRRALKEVCKKCPGKGCGWGIEKNEGCDHMTCSKCRHQFCWVCLAPYKPIRDQGNHMHRAGCVHHA